MLSPGEQEGMLGSGLLLLPDSGEQLLQGIICG